MPEQPIIVFDVNETLLDLDATRPVFDRVFDDPAAMPLWFAGLITYSEALTLAGVYVPFTDIGAAVLRMLAAARGITVSDADGAELTDRFATMPPHPEVPAALRRLRDHGFRLFTLTGKSRLYGWLMPAYSDPGSSLLQQHLPHRDPRELAEAARRLGWASWEDCHTVVPGACPWLTPTPSAQ